MVKFYFLCWYHLSRQVAVKNRYPEHKNSNQPFSNYNDFVSDNTKYLLTQNLIPLQYTHPAQFLTVSFSGCSSTAFIIKNSTCGCIATLLNGLPIVFAFTSPKFKTLETYRSIVLGEILKAAATSSTWYPKISLIQMARHCRSSLYGWGMANSSLMNIFRKNPI